MKFSSRGATLVASIQGELDHHSAEYIRQKVDDEIIKSTTKNVIFDFSRLSFMDSSGIGVIMGRYKNIMRLKGMTAITNANTQVRRILEMSGILRVIPLYDSISDAVDLLQK